MRWLCVVPALMLLTPATGTASTTNLAVASPDYPPASWVPADPSNYTVANRYHDYPISMIVIHDIEGDVPVAIQLFQTPNYNGSAHYVVGYDGAITQMVLEKDIAYHAGNWDYNTRSIGIEHAGFAAYNYYTTAEYQASAHLAASICSRYGVPMDRTHVIGHAEVPDPNNPGLFGGEDHHTDPGPYWDWAGYMNLAQTYANALPSPPHMMTTPRVVPIDGGAQISWVGQTCHLPVASYTLTVGTFTQTLPGTTTSTTVTGLQNGTSYTVTVTATNADGTDTNSTTVIPSPPCTAPTLKAAPASPGATGGSIKFTGAASTCTNPTYRFWLQSAGGTWYIVQDYGTSPTFMWTGTGNAGDYNAEVDVRQQTSPVVYDAVVNLPYKLSGCTAAKLATDSLSPQPPGTTVTLTGSSTCPGPADYRFWIRPPGGSWSIVQDYSPTTTYTWTTTGKAQGTYSLEVDVLDHGSAAPYEAVFNSTYTLGPAECHNPTLTANPPSPGVPGSTVSFTSSSTGCPNPRYRFWVSPPGGGWTIAQDYGPANTFSWTAPGTAGQYRIEVDVRDQLSSLSYDSVFNTTYTLAGCSNAGLTTDKPSPQLTGTPSVTLTGSATCPGTPEYRFWVRPPDGGWSIAQDYGASATFSWNTSKLPSGTYGFEVDVRDHGATDAYETVKNLNFTLGNCISATLTPDKPSPQPAGTTITLTGAATCTGTPEYRFWVRAPGGSWQIVRDYNSSNSFAWTPATAGTYSVEVDVRNQGSTVIYETVSNITYVLS